ncbi:MAG: hypothetical protein KDJ65_15155 [Anaerolineae bacterium]|nr:hypothetical protein [Anaerolineae bacterium]
MEKNDFAEKVANKIFNLGLTAPAIFLLEAHKPLAFLGSQLLLIGQPVLNIFLSHHLTSNAVTLFENPEHLETLITHLETKANQPFNQAKEI